MRVAVIFHGIGRPARPLEPGEAPYWIGVDQFDRVLDRIVALPGRDSLQITFDDGNLSDHDIALPRLLARGLSADFFVLSGRIGQPGALNADQIRALQSAGMRIGSHGIAHRNLAQLGDAALHAELSQSRADLEKVCGRPVTALGLPFGAYSRRVLAAARRAGYQVAYSSDKGRMNPAAFLRPRASFRGDMDAAQMDALLTGHLPAAAALRRALAMAKRRWL